MPTYRLRLLGAFDELTGQPLAGVKVSDVLSGTYSVTGKSGTVSLVFLPDGGGMVRLQKLGYAPQTFVVQISPTATTPLTIVMEHLTTLAAVVTTAIGPTGSRARSEFLDHMKSGMGFYIDDATLRKSEDIPLTSFLRSRLPAALFDFVDGEEYLTRSFLCSSGGPPQLYVNGMPWIPGFVATNGGAPLSTDQTPFDLSDFSVSDLIGVEWYPDGTMIPAEYASTSARCGALFLWLKN